MLSPCRGPSSPWCRGLAPRWSGHPRSHARTCAPCRIFAGFCGTLGRDSPRTGGQSVSAESAKEAGLQASQLRRCGCDSSGRLVRLLLGGDGVNAGTSPIPSHFDWDIPLLGDFVLQREFGEASPAGAGNPGSALTAGAPCATSGPRAAARTSSRSSRTRPPRGPRRPLCRRLSPRAEKVKSQERR